MKSFLFFLIILFNYKLNAQTISKDKKEQIDSLFTEWDKANSPGCVIGIIKDGEFIYQRGYGIANLDHGIRISSNTTFDIASMSKQFTATAIILLQQQGKLSLDDSVRKYIPELPCYNKIITIRQMLNHTSGLRDYENLLKLSGKEEEQVVTSQDALNIITKQKKLNFNSGEDWDYSNTGFFLSSLIIERVSGLSMKVFSEQNIFGPLGMKNTFFLDNRSDIVPFRATGYSPNETGGFQINMSNWEQTGDGAIQTNCNDLLLWDKNFYDPKLGGLDLIKLLTTTGKLNSGENLYYTLGLFKESFDGIELFHHGGNFAGYSSEFLRFPNEHFSVICLSNLASFDASALAREIATIYLSDEIKRINKLEYKKGTKSIKPLSIKNINSFVGYYHTEYNDILREVSEENKKLYYVRNSENKSELIYQGNDEFIIKDIGIAVKFSYDENKNVSAMNIKVGGVKPTILYKYTPVNFIKDKLIDTNGDYFSDELNITYNLQLGDSALILTPKNGDPLIMNPVTENSFVDESNEVSIELIRNKNNKIDSFYLTVSRVRKILFRRLDK